MSGLTAPSFDPLKVSALGPFTDPTFGVPFPKGSPLSDLLSSAPRRTADSTP
jgi:hypothetical protein